MLNTHLMLLPCLHKHLHTCVLKHTHTHTYLWGGWGETYVTQILQGNSFLTFNSPLLCCVCDMCVSTTAFSICLLFAFPQFEHKLHEDRYSCFPAKYSKLQNQAYFSIVLDGMSEFLYITSLLWKGRISR